MNRYHRVKRWTWRMRWKVMLWTLYLLVFLGIWFVEASAR